MKFSRLCRGSDHTGLQAPFGDLQVTVQAVDQVDQQALFLELSLPYRTLQYFAALGVNQCKQAVAVGIRVVELDLVRRQGVVEQ